MGHCKLLRESCADVGYLSRLHSGEKTNPGPVMLRRMGLRKVVSYERSTAEKHGEPTRTPAT